MHGLCSGSNVPLEVIWREVFGEKTSPSAEYYARHVLGEASIYKTLYQETHSGLCICQYNTMQNYVLKSNHVITPGNMGNYWGNFGYPRYGDKRVLQKVERVLLEALKGLLGRQKGLLGRQKGFKNQFGQ